MLFGYPFSFQYTLEVRAENVATAGTQTDSRQPARKAARAPQLHVRPHEQESLSMMRGLTMARSRMIALAPEAEILYHVAYVDPGNARWIISLRRAKQREVVGTTKSAVSRLGSAGNHARSLATFKRYAHAVGREP